LRRESEWFASFEVKKFYPSFRFEAKITKSKRSKKFKTKKSEKKRKNRLEFRFALFRFEAKIAKVKRSKKFEAKRSEKIEVKFYSKQFPISLYFAYKQKKFLCKTGAPYTKAVAEAAILLAGSAVPTSLPVWEVDVFCIVEAA
jgi:hypothetical protein